MRNVREFSEEKEKEKKAEERTICRKLQEKKSKKTSRKTSVEIGKRNQITALKFQTGGRHIRHPRPPFWATRSEKKNRKKNQVHIWTQGSVNLVLTAKTQGYHRVNG